MGRRRAVSRCNRFPIYTWRFFEWIRFQTELKPLLITCHRHVRRRAKEFKLFRSKGREGREKNWSNISTRRQQQSFSLPPPQKNNHSFRGPGSPEDSKFVSSPFFMELRENLLLLLDFGAPTWCSNQWERDLEQNSMPFLAAGDVALAHRLRERIFLEMSILAETWSGKNGEKARFLLLLPPPAYILWSAFFPFFFPQPTSQDYLISGETLPRFLFVRLE